MKVTIKSFDVSMEVKQSGVELQVNSPDGSEHLGDCYVTMTGIIWCKGRTRKKNGTKISWDHLAEICRTKASFKAALKAAKES